MGCFRAPAHRKHSFINQTRLFFFSPNILLIAWMFKRSLHHDKPGIYIYKPGIYNLGHPPMCSVNFDVDHLQSATEIWNENPRKPNEEGNLLDYSRSSLLHTVLAPFDTCFRRRPVQAGLRQYYYCCTRSTRIIIRAVVRFPPPPMMEVFYCAYRTVIGSAIFVGSTLVPTVY